VEFGHLEEKRYMKALEELSISFKNKIEMPDYLLFIDRFLIIMMMESAYPAAQSAEQA